MHISNEIEPCTPILLIPPEILGFVTGLLRNRDLIRLLRTGDSRLTRLLHQSGAMPIVKVKTSDLMPTGLPTWLTLFNSFLSLRKLTVRCSRPLKIQISDINFPNTLTSLKLYGFDQESFEPWFCDKTAFSLRVRLPKLQTLGLDISLDQAKANWIASFPETLASLKISEISADIRYPASITSIEVTDCVRAWVGSRHYFPPQLCSIKLSCNQIDFFEVFLASLPSTLESLSIRLLKLPYRGASVELKDLRLLPRHLKALEVLGVPLTCEDFTRLPPYLTKIKLSEAVLSLSSFGRFDKPRDLAKLFFSSVTQNTSLRHISLLSAPTQRQSLVYEGGSPVDMPQLLETLDCPYSTFDSAMLGTIPRYIVRLHICTIDWNVKSLPEWPVLTHFKTQNIHLSASIVRSLCRGSPLLQCFIALDSGFDLTEWSTSTDTQNIEFPDSTKSDTIGTASAESSGHLERFGLEVSSITIMKCEKVGDDFLAFLPAHSTNFKELSLPGTLAITDFGVQTHLTTCQALTTLHLGKSCVTGNCFAFLPKTLTVLCAPGAVHVEDANIKDLPRTLIEVKMKSATELSDACGAFLPSTIAYFSLEDNLNISRNILYAMPYDVVLSLRQWRIKTSKVDLTPLNLSSSEIATWKARKSAQAM